MVVFLFSKGEKEDAVLTMSTTHWKASTTSNYPHEENQNQETSVGSERQVVLHVSLSQQLANTIEYMRKILYCRGYGQK